MSKQLRDAQKCVKNSGEPVQGNEILHSGYNNIVDTSPFTQMCYKWRKITRVVHTYSAFEPHFFAVNKNRQSLGMIIQGASFTANITENPTDDDTIATTTRTLSVLTAALVEQAKSNQGNFEKK